MQPEADATRFVGIGVVARSAMGLDIDLVGHVGHEKLAVPLLRTVGQLEIKDRVRRNAIKMYAVKDGVDRSGGLAAGVGNVDTRCQRCAVAELVGILRPGMERDLRREGLSFPVGIEGTGRTSDYAASQGAMNQRQASIEREIVEHGLRREFQP